MDSSARPPGPTHAWANEVVGANLTVPVLQGRPRRYVNLDNAASTPPFVAVQDCVEQFLPWYSSVHRGTGFKSQLATTAYEEAREIVAHFVGADRQRQAVIFVKNATEGLNKVAHYVQGAGITVFTSIMEHHANLLPWRFRAANLRYVQASPDGVIDEDDLEQQLRAAPARRKLVAVSGAYNVTGYSPPVHRLARLAHRYGAEILVDGAQLVPHKRVNLSGAAAGEEIDYLVFSGHKMYAPFGTGVLVAPRDFFAGHPDVVGGGTVDLVTLHDAIWCDVPDREEAGTPNVVGAIALAAAARRLGQLGRIQVERYEEALTAYAWQELRAIPGLHLLGPSHDRVAIISFVAEHMPHGLVAAILGYEHAIGVRSGCFCAHPGMVHLLDLPADEVARLQQRIVAHDKRDVPGAVRMSLALYNTFADIDRFVEALQQIARNEIRGTYEPINLTSEYRPSGWRLDLRSYVPGLRP